MKYIRILPLIFALTALDLASAFAQVRTMGSPASEVTGSGINNVTLALAVPPSSTSPSDVLATVTLTNGSDHPLLFPESTPLNDYAVVLRRADGERVSRTSYGSALASNAIFRSRLGSLLPGSSISSTFSLSRSFDMTRSGSYLVSVDRPVYQPASTTPVLITSQVATVHVNDPTKGEKSTVAKVISRDNYSTNDVSDVWNVGDSWKIMVEVFKTTTPLRADRPAPLSDNAGTQVYDTASVFETYPMTIRVVGKGVHGSARYVTLEFLPGPESPEYVRSRSVTIDVDAKTRELVGFRSPALNLSDVVENLNGHFVIVRPINGYPVGFPCDVIPRSVFSGKNRVAHLLSADSAMSLALSRSDSLMGSVFSESLTVRTEDWFRVTQRWSKGEKWWSEYLKEDFDSQLGMRATTLKNNNVVYGPSRDGLQLGLGTEDAIALGGDIVRLRVALRNNRDTNVTIESMWLGKNLKLSLRRLDNGVVQLTDAGRDEGAQPALLLEKQVVPAHSII